jgi:hypothetical protein
MDNEQWYELIKGDLIEAGSFVIKKDNHIIAFAFMHENDECSMDLGWRGVLFAYDKRRHQIIELLTSMQIEYAKKKQIQFLNLEIDSTDPWASDMMQSFDIDIKGNWMSYQKQL